MEVKDMALAKAGNKCGPNGACFGFGTCMSVANNVGSTTQYCSCDQGYAGEYCYMTSA
jgi:hypothetical protein